MKNELFINGLVLCGVLLIAASSAFAIQPGEEKGISLLSTSDHNKLRIQGKKLDFKCPEPFSDSECFKGRSGVYVQDSILAPRAIRITKGESPVIVLQVGNEMIYYHNYFKIVLGN